jgi:catechol 2,3-dioxygenase-like lactoylglutathione lyase family enzyme
VFDHVTIRVAERSASERFYETVFVALGVDTTYSTDAFAEWHDFSLTAADRDHPVTRRLHAGFIAPSRAQVDEFWRAGTAAGYADAGAPGPRPQYREDYYGAFLLDPDGNSVEAVHHGGMHHDGKLVVDHLWIRVADLAASTAFYRTIAEPAGLVLRHEDAERTTVAAAGSGGTGSSFTLVAGPPTENLHMAFGRDDDADVRRFHATAIAAGYTDHGVPGERPQYHPGYYCAYVLDPDGNNIEVVNHHRS